MDPFVPTYLYVKRHIKTGLFYLGKTTKNPLHYRGSGLYWKRHIRVHGPCIETLWFKLFFDKDECQKTALKLSSWFKVSQSPLWANLKHENGLDGGTQGMKNPRGMAGKVQTESARLAQSLSKKGSKNPNFGKKYSTEERSKFGLTGSEHPMFNKKHRLDTKQKMSDNHANFAGNKNPMYGRKHSEETVLKMSVPKIRVCRLYDKKEMAINHFTKWANQLDTLSKDTSNEQSV